MCILPQNVTFTTMPLRYFKLLRPHPEQRHRINRKKKSELRHQKVLLATRLLTQNMAEPRAHPNLNRIHVPRGLANLG